MDAPVGAWRLVGETLVPPRRLVWQDLVPPRGLVRKQALVRQKALAWWPTLAQPLGRRLVGRWLGHHPGAGSPGPELLQPPVPVRGSLPLLCSAAGLLSAACLLRVEQARGVVLQQVAELQGIRQQLPALPWPAASVPLAVRLKAAHGRRIGVRYAGSEPKPAASVRQAPGGAKLRTGAHGVAAWVPCRRALRWP